MFEERTQKLKARLVEDGLEIALITDDDSVYYFSGFTIISIWILAVRRFWWFRHKVHRF